MYSNIGNQFINISDDMYNQRIDNFLIKILKNIPKSIIYKNIRIGKIKINNKKILPKYKLNINDILYIPNIYINKIIKKKSNLNINKIKFLKNIILFEDKYILAINKPTGIAVHGGSGINYGIIENLRFIYKKIKFLELVHRIDKDTSGILLIAKKKYVLQNLHKQLREQTIQKEYLALVKGNSQEKKYLYIKSFLLKNFSNKKNKVIVHDTKGKFSITKYKIIKNYKNTMLVKIIPLTGRTHQIRVHMAYVGHPIVYDQRYGDNEFNIQLKNNINLQRLFLHAYKINFIHPITNKNINLCAPLDELLIQYLATLKKITHD
ncbi:RluA family pseudouridine synthase [Enterobacteriaceae endosymbiont of Neohaemonia nigricornis]|uniref:RluA family pseudouridine synthase n=1 Tax=Enterobacteriaceae endosymbiont of Neohaemonia nigricornis TaxID=2675792 RepID=UPI00144904E7|nr:RluA family pseudouridine synthase [Enterobacteriaceae endosymbiont of Neohaemonia nigricornis]QJC30278.1 RluA family pseudouridine synthase [Enterobacteriaceae endosymbiont of Neohaemonia nigricornis]